MKKMFAVVVAIVAIVMFVSVACMAQIKEKEEYTYQYRWVNQTQLDSTMLTLDEHRATWFWYSTDLSKSQENLARFACKSGADIMNDSWTQEPYFRSMDVRGYNNVPLLSKSDRTFLWIAEPAICLGFGYGMAAVEMGTNPLKWNGAMTAAYAVCGGIAGLMFSQAFIRPLLSEDACILQIRIPIQ